MWRITTCDLDASPRARPVCPVTQASAVWEVRSIDPTMTRRRLLRSGMRIGRDHVASTVNILVLAYAGASVPLLILFVLADQPAGTVANGEVVATAIVRTLVGRLGLLASVPITTWLAAPYREPFRPTWEHGRRGVYRQGGCGARGVSHPRTPARRPDGREVGR